jgi:hypothetical protein
MVGRNQRHEIRVVAHGDVSLWMEGIGPADGPPLLLVMGANASAMTWPDALVYLWSDAGLHAIRRAYIDESHGRCSTTCDPRAAAVDI